MKDLEDNRIVSEVLGGDKNAYALLVKKYEKPIYNLMYRITGSQDLSMDMSQMTLVKAYEKLERFNLAMSFFPWLYAIGINVARDYLRKAKREACLFESSYIECSTIDENSDSMTRVEKKMEISHVFKAMEKLRFSQREALILRFREGLSMKEVAQALSISVSGAKMRIHRALIELRKIL
jgi:RNA polymerase sigma-70 factor (ECF subfamily)